MTMDGKDRVLVIDDEEIVLDSCRSILGSRYDVRTASNGGAGLELAREYHPDLVIVDLKMPGISGFDVLERFRSDDPTVVCIVITGFATVDSAVEAMKKGAYDFLPKPFTPEELRMIAARGLERRKLILEGIALRREKEMLRDNFAAVVSHELKSPLNALLQNLFVVARDVEGALSAEQRERLGKLKGRISGLLTLIDTWLRVLSVDISKIRERFQPVSLEACAAEACESVQPHAQRMNVEIVRALPGSLPQVLGDAGTLAEALTNLIGNAVKYSHPGGKVEVRAAAEGSEVVVAVSDAGIGIPGEELPYIFEDFFRGREGAAKGGGAGLGLAITRRIVEAHGGRISVESEPGKGSTFRVHLPVAPPA